MLYNCLRYALLGCFVWLLHFSSIAVHAACPLPTSSSRVLSMCFFKSLLAERAEVKIWRLKRFWFEHVHVATAIELCAAVGFGPL